MTREHLKKMLDYNEREELQVQAFHKLTNNRYKTGLKLLCPLKALDSNNKYHDYSGNNFHGTPTGVSIIGNGPRRHTFANGLTGVDQQFITFTGINLGTNDFSISICASHFDSAYVSGNAHVVHGYLGNLQQVEISYRDDPATVRGNINNALMTTTETFAKDGKLHYITLTGDRDGNGTIYVDQDVVDTVSISGTSATTLDLGTWRVFKRDVGTVSYLTGGGSWFMIREGVLTTHNEHKKLDRLHRHGEFTVP